MFTVRIAFVVPPTTKISADEVSTSLENIELSLKTDGQYHILLAEGFSSFQDAQDFLSRLNASLSWLLLQKGVAAEGFLQPQTVTYQADPWKAAENLSRSFGGKIEGPVDGIIDGSEAAIYLTEKHLRFATLGQPTVFTTVPANYALQVLVEGVGFPNSGRLHDDPKLNVALKLYGAYFTEQSATARFLTLIMALEALTAPTPKSQLAVALLEKWSAELLGLKDTVESGTEDAVSLDALHRELFFRRDDSVRSQVRKLVLNTLAGEPDATERAKEALRLYDLRSTLVHEGVVETPRLALATSDAKTLVHRVLLTRFRRVTA